MCDFSGVVRVEPFVEVLGDSRVMASRVRFAHEDVDEDIILHGRDHLSRWRGRGGDTVADLETGLPGRPASLGATP